MTDLRHHHTVGDQPTVFAWPPSCCARTFTKAVDRLNAEHGRRLDAAVRDERVRIVTEALAAIAAYGDAVRSVLDDDDWLLVGQAVEKCADAVRKTGCICPLVNVGTFGDPHRTMPGRDPRCGLHDGQEAAR